MSFYQKYELMKLVHNGEPKTFQARETSSGRIVYLHLLGNVEHSKQSKLLTDLQQRLRDFPNPDLAGILDLDPSTDAPYVVTPALEGLPTLWDWIDTWSLMPKPEAARTPVPEVFAAAPPPETPPPAPIPAVLAQGEFTRKFLGSLAPAPPPAPSVPAPAAPAPAPGGPGEFTRMFLSAQAPAPPQPVAAPIPGPASPVPQPVAPPAAEPGEFTRMFLSNTPAPAAAPPPAPLHPEFAHLATQEFAAVPPPVPMQQAPAYRPPAPAPVEKAGPGEFTKFFASPLGAKPLPVEEVERGLITPPPAPSGRPFQGPSDFTMRFGDDSPPGVPAAPQYAAPSLSGDATGLFSSSAPVPRESTPYIQGPSEFTRVLQGAPPASGGFSPPAPAPSAAPPGSYLPSPVPQTKPLGNVIIAIVAFLALGLVLAAVYLLFKK